MNGVYVTKFLENFDVKIQNILILSGIYSKADLVEAFKTGIIRVGLPRGIGKKHFEVLKNLISDEDIVDESELFLSNFKTHTLNYCKRNNILFKEDLFDYFKSGNFSNYETKNKRYKELLDYFLIFMS